MTTAEQKRESVAKAYANAVSRQPERSNETSGCCGGSCGAATAEPKGVAAQFAGYDQQELALLPDDAVTNSFGCGNPLGMAGVREGDTVLDLGSGAGIDLIIAAKRVGPAGRVIGVDMTDAMVEHARENVRAAGVENVEVRSGMIEFLPVESASIDWVISNCVINLSPEKDRVFREMMRVLKPGGRISVSDIVVDSLPAPLREQEAVYNSCIGGAVSEAEYLAGLRRAGFEEVGVVDRMDYSAEQIAGIIQSDSESDQASCCGGSAFASGDAAEARVSSVRLAARKPLQG